MTPQSGAGLLKGAQRERHEAEMHEVKGTGVCCCSKNKKKLGIVFWSVNSAFPTKTIVMESTLRGNVFPSVDSEHSQQWL